MKLKKYILCGLLAATGTAAFTACDDLFRDTPADKMSETDIWRNPMLLDEYVLPWYRNMNNGFSTYVPTTIALVKSASRYFMPWFGDQIVPSKTDYYNAGYGDLLKGNQQEITNWARVNWSNYYTQIQSINRMFTNEGEIAEGEQKRRVEGEGYFFRAYYYYLLWRQFGGVMLIKEPFDPLNDSKKFPRASYEEMVASIVDDARKAAERLPLDYDAADKGRVTKGAAMMLIAKTADVHRRLQALFETRAVEKEYIALLQGTVAADSGLIDLPLGPSPHHRPCQEVRAPHAKPAQTRYEVLERREGRTLVRFRPLTGRTHQLRVHAAHAEGLGCPIVGDPLYGTPADRLYLHARSLRFVHPVTGKTVEAISEILRTFAQA